jgi:hypothetical protein
VKKKEASAPPAAMFDVTEWVLGPAHSLRSAPPCDDEEGGGCFDPNEERISPSVAISDIFAPLLVPAKLLKSLYLEPAEGQQSQKAPRSWKKNRTDLLHAPSA